MLLLTNLGVDVSASGVENYKLFQASKVALLQIWHCTWQTNIEFTLIQMIADEIPYNYHALCSSFIYIYQLQAFWHFNTVFMLRKKTFPPADLEGRNQCRTAWGMLGEGSTHQWSTHPLGWTESQIQYPHTVQTPPGHSVWQYLLITKSSYLELIVLHSIYWEVFCLNCKLNITLSDTGRP
jgi:hypothetical protein